MERMGLGEKKTPPKREAFLEVNQPARISALIT